MLDPRTYRAAFVPVLVAVLVAAFSLQARPRPIGTTLAPDAFDGADAQQTLQDYAHRFPARRPGQRGDEELAARVARDLSVLGPGAVHAYRADAQTIDGRQRLTTVVATRPGRSGPGLVVVAHRDAAHGPATAELSGTAVLVELARIAATGRLRRSVTFVSTSGGSGGLAGAAAAVARLPRPVDAVLVLGDLGSRSVHKPWVTGWSNGGGSAPLRLQRTVEAAVRAEARQAPGGLHASAQWARLAFPATLGEQGAFGAAGLPSVLVSAGGERPPAPSAPVEEGRLTASGRAVLRTVFALDNGPDVAAGPERALVVRRKVLPTWAVRLVVAAALLPVWVAVLDGAARVRRRRLPLGAALRWALATAVPFALVALLARALGVAGLLSAHPGAPVPAGVVAVDGSAVGALVALGLTFVLGWVGVRPAVLRAVGAREPVGDAHAAAVALVVAAVSLGVWVANPFAAALLVVPAHLWLLAVAPEARLPRGVAALIALLALLPAGLALRSVALQLGYGPGDAAWSAVLLVAGGHVGPLAWLTWALLGGAGVGVAVLVARRRPEAPPQAAAVAVRGPRSYAGPGSLGGTDSALRR